MKEKFSSITGVSKREFIGHSCWLAHCTQASIAMNGENRPLVADEPVEFEKKPVEVLDSRKITHHFRGIMGICPELIKNNPKDPNMQRAVLGNTRILADHAQKSPRTLAYRFELQS